jgi:hypothetical protein
MVFSVELDRFPHHVVGDVLREVIRAVALQLPFGEGLHARANALIAKSLIEVTPLPVNRRS